MLCLREILFLQEMQYLQLMQSIKKKKKNEIILFLNIIKYFQNSF